MANDFISAQRVPLEETKEARKYLGLFYWNHDVCNCRSMTENFAKMRHCYCAALSKEQKILHRTTFQRTEDMLLQK
jgi:hypothetical protein